MPISGLKFFGKKLRFWLPRIFVAAFALSLLIPAPDFVSGMSDDAFVVWLIRIGWILGLPLAFCFVLVLMAWSGKGAFKGKPNKTG
jgi:hypothetical protein